MSAPRSLGLAASNLVLRLPLDHHELAFAMAGLEAAPKERLELLGVRTVRCAACRVRLLSQLDSPHLNLSQNGFWPIRSLASYPKYRKKSLGA